VITEQLHQFDVLRLIVIVTSTPTAIGVGSIYAFESPPLYQTVVYDNLSRQFDSRADIGGVIMFPGLM